MSTGRGVISKMDTVDEARPIDILELQKKGLFKQAPNAVWTSTWRRGEEVRAAVSFKLLLVDDKPAALRFMYTAADRNTGEKTEYDYLIELTSTPCNFGGERWWFVCPLIVNGRRCNRRARIIYIPYGAVYFGCRKCHRLSYDSRQLSRNPFYEVYKRIKKDEQQGTSLVLEQRRKYSQSSRGHPCHHPKPWIIIRAG